MGQKIKEKKKAKRILIVCQHFWPESFRINDIADFLANEKGCEVEVLCGLPNYPKGQIYKGYSAFKNRKQKHNNVLIRRTLEIPRGNNSNIRIFVNYISFPIFSLFHVPRLLTNKYDKILIYQLSPVMMSIAGIIVGKIKKTEVIMYVLDLWPENLYSVLDIKNKIVRQLVGAASHWHYRHVDKLIALSQKMKNKLTEITNKPSGSIVILPQACEKIYETSIKDQDLKDRFNKTFNIVFTGNISPAQSFETIIKTAVALSNKGIKDIKWIIVGEGMSRMSVEERVKEEGLSEYFSFEGHKQIEDIPRYTEIADVLVGCLVKSELLEATIPAKVMSYIASGKPIVLAMDGEVQDLINKKIRCGYAGPAENYEELASNILKVYKKTAEERHRLGEASKKYHFQHLERNLVLGRLYSFIFDK